MLGLQTKVGRATVCSQVLQDLLLSVRSVRLVDTNRFRLRRALLKDIADYLRQTPRSTLSRSNNLSEKDLTFRPRASRDPVYVSDLVQWVGDAVGLW